MLPTGLGLLPPGASFLIACVILLSRIEGFVVAEGLAPDATEATFIMPWDLNDANASYLCSTVKLDRVLHISKVTAVTSDPSVVHHIQLLGCSIPSFYTGAQFQPAKPFPCNGSPPCPGGNSFSVYAWSKRVNPIALPEGKAITVGPGTTIPVLFVQLHYKPGGRTKPDTSGIKIEFGTQPAPQLVGEVVIFPPVRLQPELDYITKSGVWCYDGTDPLEIFVYKGHTHTYGTKTYMQRSMPGVGHPKSIEEDGPILVSSAPKVSQAYDTLSEALPVLHGDTYRVTCIYNTTGAKGDLNPDSEYLEEMCVCRMYVSGEMGYSIWNNPGQQLYPIQSRTASLYTLPWTSKESQRTEAKGLGFSGIAKQPRGGGSLWLFSRGDQFSDEDSFRAAENRNQIATPVVFQIDRDTGALLQSWGSNTFYLPHMITIDREGNVWTADSGAHQVFKHAPDGRQLLVLGQALTPGSDFRSFCEPTHVAVSQNGTIFVADGHCNSRIMRFSADGTLERQYDLPVDNRTTTNSPAAAVPHSLALNECLNMVWVADSQGGSVLALDLKSGDVIRQWRKKDSDLKPIAVRVTAFGGLFVLMWDGRSGNTAQLVLLETIVGRRQSFMKEHASWVLPGLVAPHDMEVAPGPLGATKTGTRPTVVLITDLGGDGEGFSKGDFQVKRFTIENDNLSQGQTAASAENLFPKFKQAQSPAPAEQQPFKQEDKPTEEDKDETSSALALVFLAVGGLAVIAGVGLVAVRYHFADRMLTTLPWWQKSQGYQHPSDALPRCSPRSHDNTLVFKAM